MAIIACVLAFASCADDVYDPERGTQTEPKENPFGENFTAPNGFNWSMINSVNLNVEIKDEFNGQYNYLIEVFTSNPLNVTALTPIAAGIAKSGSSYTANINVSNAIKRLYIRQTDPKQRKEVYEYTVPENGGNLNCKLYITQSATRAHTATRAANDLTDPAYVEPTVPANAKELKNEEYPYGANLWTEGDYVIKSGSTFTPSITAGKGVNIYVQGIQAGSLTLQDNATLTILNNGEVNGSSLLAQSTSKIKNFGTLTAGDITMHSATEFYNKGSLNGTGKIDLQGDNTKGAQFYNIGTVVLSNGFSANSNCQILNQGTMKVTKNLTLTSARLDNKGIIETINQGDELIIQMNGKYDAILNNFENATINATSLYRGATINNYGTIVLKTLDSKGDGDNAIYNACTFIVTDKFALSNTLILDNGSITGAREEKKWKTVKEFTLYNSAKVTLQNNSIILAETLIGGNTGAFIGKGNTFSMIKATTTKYPGQNTFTGLVLDLGQEYVYKWKESGNGYYPLENSDWQITKENCSLVGDDASKHTIETCAGIIYGGNKGGTPTEPEFPIEIAESSVYTFIFEDNWPTYGDFDMNDLVLVMPYKKIKTNDQGHVIQVEMRIELRAVGASKNLGAGIRFLKLPSDQKIENIKVNKEKVTFEKGQNEATYILFNQAHLALWGNDNYKENGTYINTLPNEKNLKKDTKGFDIFINIPDSENLTADVFNINNIDIFAITSPATDKSNRTEVHAAGFKPTQLANTRNFDQGNDKSLTKGQYYVSEDNLAWAVVIPTEFAWPQEHNKISLVYPHFERWVTSGGKQDGDDSGNGKWYDFNNGNAYPIKQLSPLDKN